MTTKKVIEPTFAVAAIRAGVVRSGLAISKDEQDRLIRSIVKEVLTLTSPYQPPETVTLEEHQLLVMKYQTTVQLLELYTKRDSE